MVQVPVVGGWWCFFKGKFLVILGMKGDGNLPVWQAAVEERWTFDLNQIGSDWIRLDQKREAGRTHGQNKKVKPRVRIAAGSSE